MTGFTFRVPMRHQILALLLFIVPARSLLARSPHDRALSASEFQIRDTGAVRKFIVATDEIGRIDSRGRGSVEKVARQQDAESLRQLAPATADLVMYEKGRARTPYTRRWLTSHVLAKLAAGVDAAELVTRVGAKSVEYPDAAPGYAVFIAPQGAGNAISLAALLAAEPGVELAEPMLARLARKRFTPNDPLFADNPANPGYQWHLRNLGTRGGLPGIDLNVTTAWDAVRGNGVRIGVMDDGLDLSNGDIAAAADTANDRDFNDNDDDPSPGEFDDHGTSVAGLAAARGNNNAGGAGAAPEATLVGLRMLGGPQTDAVEAGAISWRKDIIQVKSSSWGPDDDGATIEGPGILAAAAIQDAIATGRAGKGTLFFWAAGNGGVDDNANFDGYANSIFVSAIGAVTDAGVQADYSEDGANLLGVVPSDGGAQMLTTTDRAGLAGYNDGFTAGNYIDANSTNDFGGTSAAAPLASGVAALVLQANPNLGWRDVQEILIRTASKNDASNAGWTTNGAGFHFNHHYGAGLLDASAAVAMAPGWVNLGAMASQRKTDVIPATIPDFPAAGATRSFTFNGTENLRVEHATVAVDISHAERGSLEIDLTSPSGTVSHLATQRFYDPDADLIWTFSTVRHWGESAAGMWTITVRDGSIGTTGTLNRVTLTLYGSSPTNTTSPVVNSPTTATGNAGSPFSYQITAANGPTNFNATGLPTGISVNATTGLISGITTTTGTINAGISATNAIGTGNATLQITMGANLNASIADAVDQPSLPWSNDTTAPWTRITGTAPATHDGTDAGRSAAIANDRASGFSVLVTGPQVVRFWWKVSSEANYDFLVFSLDDVEQAAISGTVDWQQRGFVIPAGTHELRWSYEKDVSATAGSDAGWVDQVTLTPFATSAPVFTTEPEPLTVGTGSIAAFVADAEGPGSITYQWRRNGVNITGATGRAYAIASATAAANGGTYTCVATNANGSTTSLPAVLSVIAANASIANAVDSTGLVWTRSGAVPQWTGITTIANTHDGIDAAQATGVNLGADTTISATVIGPGTLEFWWRADGTADEDFLGYNLDGYEEDYITATGAWVQATESIPPGIHTISWTHYTGTAGSGLAARSLVDQVTFTPTAFGTWQGSKFTTAQRLDPRFAGPDADPDSDGITNLGEHYLGGDPLANNAGPLPKLSQDGASFAMTYKRDTSANTTIPTFEHSINLHNWLPVVPVESIISTNGTIQTIKATFPSEIGAPHFYRLSLELAE